MRIYKNTLAQLITLWCLGIILSFMLLVDENYHISPFLGVIIPFGLLYYTLEWKKNRIIENNSIKTTTYPRNYVVDEPQITTEEVKKHFNEINSYSFYFFVFSILLLIVISVLWLEVENNALSLALIPIILLTFFSYKVRKEKTVLWSIIFGFYYIIFCLISLLISTVMNVYPVFLLIGLYWCFKIYKSAIILRKASFQKNYRVI